MIRYKFMLLILVFLQFTSCEKKIETEDLIGKWSVAKKKIKIEDIDKKGNIIEEVILEPPHPPGYIPFGIKISNNKIDFLRGLYKNDSTKKTQRGIKYLGLTANYKLINDSIFYQKPESEWKFLYRVIKICKDTLTITTDNINFQELVRNHPKININFDKVILSHSGYWLICPEYDVSINSKGDVYFQGKRRVEPLGLFQAKTDSTMKNLIFRKFGKANIEKLDKEYSQNYTDGASITTTFIKNNRILKTIHDYEKAAPNELIWAYVPMQHIHEQVQLDSLNFNNYGLQFVSFTKDESEIKLEKSESFYLLTEIFNSKVVNKEVKKDYKVKYYDKKDKILEIQTDGRLFKISHTKKTITYDLGYNFIERNFKNNSKAIPN